MKKAFAILLSLALMLSLAVPAMAAETVTNNTNHDYKAYQIFKGTQGEGVALGDVDWGTGIDATKKAALMTALTAEDAFNTCTDAAGVAGVLAGKSDNDPVVLKFAQIVSKHLSSTAKDISRAENSSVELDAGYYLLVDQTTTSGVEGEVKGLSLLQVTKDGDITITLKTEKPRVDKEVYDEATDDDKEPDENWGETADHDIGEEFQFRLTATIPANTMTYFDSYKIIFTDTMSDGITFVRIDSVTVDEKNVDSAKYEETATNAANKDGLDWTLTIKDVKTAVSPLNTAAAVEVVVTYTAKLNENAAIGNKDDNKNTVGLQYSNNPNVGAGGELGKTKEDTVWVFTYEINGTKVDGADEEKPLPGAEFVLYRKVTRNDAEVTEYVTLDDNNKVTGWVPTKPTTGNIKTVADGIIKITGLDHGTYYLEETKAPAGYNKLETPYTVEITAEHDEAKDTNSAATSITYKVNTKEATAIKVINNAGTVLPETGGMGTTIFYAVGGVMVAAAAILLITKKRLSNNA